MLSCSCLRINPNSFQQGVGPSQATNRSSAKASRLWQLGMTNMMSPSKKWRYLADSKGIGNAFRDTHRSPVAEITLRRWPHRQEERPSTNHNRQQRTAHRLLPSGNRRRLSRHLVSHQLQLQWRSQHHLAGGPGSLIPARRRMRRRMRRGRLGMISHLIAQRVVIPPGQPHQGKVFIPNFWGMKGRRQCPPSRALFPST